ncbi:hypothetical protein GC194_12670 [bacterium]|nr:hypothetical protein [bacterium]
MHQILVLAHVLVGSLALLAGALAGFLPKGSSKHKSWGKVFFIAMSMAAILAIIITTIKPNFFLQAIALITLYMLMMGFGAFRQHVYLRYLPVLGWLVAVYMFYAAFSHYSGFLLIAFIFGLGQAYMSLQDFFWPIKNKVVLHASRMGGAYMASVTALFVNVVHFLPWYVAWFAPSIIGTVLLTRGIRRYLREG